MAKAPTNKQVRASLERKVQPKRVDNSKPVAKINRPKQEFGDVARFNRQVKAAQKANRRIRILEVRRGR